MCVEGTLLWFGWTLIDCKQRAGLQRAVFGSADGLTFYTALGAPDTGSQRCICCEHAPCVLACRRHRILLCLELDASLPVDDSSRRTGSDGGGNGDVGSEQQESQWQSSAQNISRTASMASGVLHSQWRQRRRQTQRRR